MGLDQNSFWNSNLLSGLIGTLIGSAISLFAIILQNKNASKLQKEAFEQQNKILKDTFENEVKSLRLERKIVEEISFLNKVYSAMELGKCALFKLRGGANTLQHKINEPGFITNVFTFRNEVSDYIDEFIGAVEGFNFLDEISEQFQIRPDFKKDLENAITDLEVDFRVTYSGYFLAFNEEQLQIINPKLERVNKLINEFESWINDNIALIMKQKRKILAIENKKRCG